MSDTPTYYAEQLTVAPDQAVELVRILLLRRSQAGLEKYGVSTDRTDLSLADWLRHSLEEQLDNAVYTQRALMELERRVSRVSR